MTIKLDFNDETARRAAAQFCAELVRQGTMFRAIEQGEWLLIEFTGGF